MFKVSDVKFSEMKNKDILDSTGQKIGRIIDFHFSYEDDQIKLKSIVMGGSRIEEFLESIGLRPDIDPFFALDIIDRYEDDKLHLKVEYKKLEKPVKLGPKEMRLSELSTLQIIDAEKQKIGNIIDVAFDKTGHISFVVGGGFFEELSEKLRIRPDIDLLVPQELIDQLSSDAINIKASQFHLTTTAEKEWNRYKRLLETQPQLVDTKHKYLWVGKQPFA